MRQRSMCRLVASGLLCLATLSVAWADTADPATVEELFERSGDVYRDLSHLEITLTTLVEIPQADAGERVTRYVLGSGRRAAIDIGSLMRIVVTDETVLVEHLGVEDRFLELTVEGDDLGVALAAARGRSSMAGFWEPPQAALRAGKPLAGVLESFRYSRLLGELSIVQLGRSPDSSYEVRLEAVNGSCVARFDPATFHLVEVEWLVEPPGAPEGYAMKVSGRYTTKAVADPQGLFEFERGDRRVVGSIRDLAADPPGISRPPEALLAPQALEEQLMSVVDLAAALRDERILLIGEEHLTEEIPQYATALLAALDDRPVSLLLEMPRDEQAAIDSYFGTGDEAILSEIFSGKPVLQLQHLLRWSFEHKERVLDVRAFDEPLYEIRLKRAFLADTRNVTMSRAMHRAWLDHPDRRVVAYAGQLHLMRTGRYRVDLPSRDTAGSRLAGLGVPAHEIAGVMINGAENFHLHSIWGQAGALPMSGGPVRIPIAYLIDYPIFGAKYADELFDYFVHVGPLTPIKVDLE